MLPQRTVLLAEPEAQLRAAWRRALDATGFYVRESADGYTVWELSPNQERRALRFETLSEAVERSLRQARVCRSHKSGLLAWPST